MDASRQNHFGRKAFRYMSEHTHEKMLYLLSNLSFEMFAIRCSLLRSGVRYVIENTVFETKLWIQPRDKWPVSRITVWTWPDDLLEYQKVSAHLFFEWNQILWKHLHQVYLDCILGLIRRHMGSSSYQEYNLCWFGDQSIPVSKLNQSFWAFGFPKHLDANRLLP